MDKRIGIAGLAFVLGVVLTAGMFAWSRSHGFCGPDFKVTRIVAPK